MVLTEFDEEKYEEMIRNEERIKTLCILVAKKTITLKKALEECNLTESEFLNEMKEYGKSMDWIRNNCPENRTASM